MVFRRSGNELNDGQDRAPNFPPFILELIDSAEVQRSHYITQNGFTSTSYPNLTHTRKVHMIGTAKNAIRMWDATQEYGPVRFEDSAAAVYLQVIASAAVLHDIGHSPFSHDLEVLIQGFSGKKHEQVAAEIITGEFSLREYFAKLPSGIIPDAQRDALVRLFSSMPTIPEILANYGISAEHVAQIIHKKRTEIEPQKKDVIGVNIFLREFIDGNVVDADKLEYLVRDPHNAGITDSQFRPEGIISSLGIVEVGDQFHLGVSDKGVDMVAQLLTTRAYMYSRAYTHKTVLRKQAMIYDAVKRFLKSLGDKAKEYGSMLHLLDEPQFETFIATHCEDPLAINLYLTAKYNRKGMYRIAYRIEGHQVSPHFETPWSQPLRMLMPATKNDITKEEEVRQEILARAKANGTAIEEHDIIVYYPYPRTVKSLQDLLGGFELFVFDHRNLEIPAYDAREVLTGLQKGISSLNFDDRLHHAFMTYTRQPTSNYFVVLASPDKVKAVHIATKEYIDTLKRGG